MTTRDMTFAQFKAAAARNKFELVLGGAWLKDISGKTETHFGTLFDAKTKKTLYRRSIAYCIAQREASKPSERLAKARLDAAIEREAAR